MGGVTKEKVGLQIKQLRKRAKLSQETVAESVGIDAKSLSRIENGRHYPSLETLELISAVIGEPLKSFFEFPTEPEPEEAVRAYLRRLSESKDLSLLREVVATARQIEKNNVR